MSTYNIPVTWTVHGTMEIEANSLAEAETKALTEAPLPTDGEYVDDSCRLDKDHPEYGHMIGECPQGGDTNNDCEGCAYSGDYHFVDGECVKREPHEDKA